CDCVHDQTPAYAHIPTVLHNQLPPAGPNHIDPPPPGRVSPPPASDGRPASRSSPCGRVAGRWPAQPETIADRTTRTPASRGDSPSGSWLRPDGRSGWTSWRPPSSARSRPSSDTRACELRNLQWLVPTGRPCVFLRYFARVSNRLANYTSGVRGPVLLPP